MFTCIACTKQMADDGGEEGGGARGSGTPSTKEAVKSLTAQVLNPTPSLSFSLCFKYNLCFCSFFFSIFVKTNKIASALRRV